MPHPPRWPTLWQRSPDALFLLNGQRRLLFVNSAWTTLTGLPSADVLRFACRRYRKALPGTARALLAPLAPPPEVLRGQPARVRRLVISADATRRWCDLDFSTFHDARGRLRILGKISVLEPAAAPAAPLAESLVALRAEVAQRYRLDQVDESDPAGRRVLAQARLAAQTRATVLIVGEPGAGKQWLARAIHYQGPSDPTFATLDCSRLPAPAFVGLLFGATTPAVRNPAGTLYLKDPAALPRDVQARLCDWLGEPEANRPRVIAGLSIEPTLLVETGRLLPELHCGLATVVITLPPLRDRMAEMTTLVERLLKRANSDGEPAVAGLTPDAWEFLRHYQWPGNLRELFAVVRAARVRSGGQPIDTGHLPAHLRQAVILDRTPGRSAERPIPLDDLMAQVERRLIQLALRITEQKKSKEDTRGRKARAAEVLGINVPRLLRRMEALGITTTYD